MNINAIATMLGVTGGCEPEFALSYTRKTENLKESYEIYCKSVDEYWNMTDNAIDKDNIDSLPSYFITSKDILWNERVNTQAIMQEYIDTAISSTINLPQEIPLEEVEKIYLYAWQKGLKGITIYRSGCAREGILTVDKEIIDNTEKVAAHASETPIQALPRGVIVDVSDDLMGVKRKLTTGCGSIHLETYFDELTGEPQETFINIGSSGGCERNYQFISRLISLALRAGVPIEAIIDQAKSVRPCNAYVMRAKSKGDTSRGTSCPSAIGFALESLFEKTKSMFGEEESVAQLDQIEDDNKDVKIVQPKTLLNNKATCPDCGDKISYEGACMVCHSCGWNGCGD